MGGMMVSRRPNRRASSENALGPKCATFYSSFNFPSLKVKNDSSAELGVDETRHASEEASTAPLLQREDIREGAEQLAICGRAVFSSAEVTSVGDVRELWDCQVNARARQVFGSDLSERGIVVRIPAGVTGLARREERIIALGHTPPRVDDGERAARPQDCR